MIFGVREHGLIAVDILLHITILKKCYQKFYHVQRTELKDT